jgi:tetratricopeptide (TPR) repeat protein
VWLWLCSSALAACLGACATGAVTSGGQGAVAGQAKGVGDPLAEISPDQLYAQGELLARNGEVLRSEEYLSAALQRGYPAQKVLPLLLKVCLAASRLGAALNYARPYLQLHPEDYHLRYLVAAVQFGQSRPDEAARELRRVLQQQPDFAQAHYLLDVILRDHEHDLAAATQHFLRHQALDPRGLHGAEVAAWLDENADAVTTPSDLQPPARAAPEPSP